MKAIKLHVDAPNVQTHASLGLTQLHILWNEVSESLCHTSIFPEPSTWRAKLTVAFGSFLRPHDFSAWEI